MNKKIISDVIKKPPVSEKAAYIFVNDRKDLCEAIVTVGFTSLYIAPVANDYYFDADSFCTFIRDISNTGTSVMDYIFVLACYRKKSNDLMTGVLKNNLIPHHQATYTLFHDKEYLANYQKQDELEKILSGYVKRFSGPEHCDIDKGQFHRFKDDGSPKSPHEYRIVQYIMTTIPMFVVNQELYIYHSGVYTMDENGIFIKAVIQSLLYEQFINTRNLSAIFSLLISQKEFQKEFTDLNAYPAHWINFKNGMFDVRETKMRKHDPEYLSTNQIPHDLDFSARENLDEVGKETIKFLDSAIPATDDRTMLFEYIGYCMTRDTGFQKFMIIKGAGGTGKSRIINIIQEIIGRENYSNISLQDLNQKFYPSLLYGKLLNACADISSDGLNTVDTIKKVTGEDILIYEKKGKDPKSFRSYAKLIFSANKIPLNLDEKSNAFYRRLLILEMNQIPGVVDRELDEKLSREIQYIIWNAIAWLQVLYDSGKFCESANSRAHVEELHRAADTVKAFMDECTVGKADGLVKRDLLHEKYLEYCKGYGRKEMGANSFYKSLDEKGYRSKRTSSGRYYTGIDLMSEDFIKVDDEEGEKVFGDK